MSNYQPHNQRPFEQQHNRQYRQQEAGNYPNDQFYNPQQHSRDPWRQGRDVDQDESYGWNRGDRDFERQGARAAYGEEGEYQRDYAGRRNTGYRSQGNYPDYEAMNPRGRFQGGRSHWPETAQQAAEFGTGYSGGRGSRNQRDASPYPDSSLMDYGDLDDRQADYSFGGNRGMGAQGGFAQQSYRGRAPKGYERSDERVREDICERLSQDHHVDASDISVTVQNGIVTLEGTIGNRQQKHRVEDIADTCSGVKDVQNRLSVIGAGKDRARQGALQGESRQQVSEPTLETAANKTSSQQQPTRQ